MAAIVAGEILFKYSVDVANGDSSAGTANGSLGGAVSTTEWAGGSANDLFDDISGAENAASTVDYRCIFIHNSNGANALENAVVYLDDEVAGGANVEIGVDPTAASAVGAAAPQSVKVADETTAPAGVTFSAPTTAGTGLSLGNIPAGSVKAFWIKRSATNSAALSNDGVTIGVTGDTGSL